MNRLDEIFAKRSILVKHFLAIAKADAAELPFGLGKKAAINAVLRQRDAEVDAAPVGFGIGHDARGVRQEQWSDVNRQESADDDRWLMAIKQPAAARRP